MTIKDQQLILTFFATLYLRPENLGQLGKAMVIIALAILTNTLPLVVSLIGEVAIYSRSNVQRKVLTIVYYERWPNYSYRSNKLNLGNLLTVVITYPSNILQYTIYILSYLSNYTISSVAFFIYIIYIILGDAVKLYILANLLDKGKTGSGITLNLSFRFKARHALIREVSLSIKKPASLVLTQFDTLQRAIRDRNTSR